MRETGEECLAERVVLKAGGDLIGGQSGGQLHGITHRDQLLATKLADGQHAEGLLECQCWQDNRLRYTPLTSDSTRPR